MNKTISKLLIAVSVFLIISCKTDSQDKSGVHPNIWVRDGYQLTVAVDAEEGPRHMTLGPDGTLYFSNNNSNIITSAKDADGDGYFETVKTYHEADNTAYNVLWYDGALWYSEAGAIYKTFDKDKDGVADEVTTVIPEEDLVSGGGHSWRPLLIHNGRIYTGIGDSGNITDETDSERQKIWSFNIDGTDKKLFCSGTRNTEKLVVRPGTDEIWGMDHGSDWFGRELGESRGMQPITNIFPPEEMNHYVEGGFYGHPFIEGKGIPRYEYIDRPDIVELADKTIGPEWEGGAHWASNGMMFYDSDQFPSEHKGDAFVAYHGSWNRDPKAGYQVTRVMFEDGHPYGELPYVKFLTEDKEVLGRPVDVIQGADGSILISEDGGRTVDGYKQNKIYRLKYVGE
jgi:glucose/arabinose dehydrogenase